MDMEAEARRAHPRIEATAACGICIVKVQNTGRMLRSCCTPIEEGMDILTETPEIVQVRRGIMELTLSRHPNECLTCLRNQNCELQSLAADFGTWSATQGSHFTYAVQSSASTYTLTASASQGPACTLTLASGNVRNAPDTCPVLGAW